MQFMCLVVIGALLAPCFEAASLMSDEVANSEKENTIEFEKKDYLYEINAGDNFFEGDMILSPEMRQSRNLILSKTRLWPDGIQYYSISSSMSSQTEILNKVRTAVTTLNGLLTGCINLRQTSDPNQKSIVVQYGNGCSASVGYGTYWQLSMNLSPYCPVGSIMHEFMHSMGMLHEQSRSDRDQYVRINYQNIQQGMEGNFQKADPNSYSTMGTPYDYGSIMHYGKTGFSINGQNTIDTLQPGAVIGQRDRVSTLDVMKLKKMYGCA